MVLFVLLCFVVIIVDFFVAERRLRLMSRINMLLVKEAKKFDIFCQQETYVNLWFNVFSHIRSSNSGACMLTVSAFVYITFQLFLQFNMNDNVTTPIFDAWYFYRLFLLFSSWPNWFELFDVWFSIHYTFTIPNKTWNNPKKKIIGRNVMCQKSENKWIYCHYITFLEIYMMGHIIWVRLSFANLISSKTYHVHSLILQSYYNDNYKFLCVHTLRLIFSPNISSTLIAVTLFFRRLIFSMAFPYNEQTN